MAEQKKKTVLVMGADAGWGLSLVKHFLRENFEVFARDHRSDAELHALVREYGDALAPIPLDVADMDSVRGAARQVVERTNGLDIIINNAGAHLKDSMQSADDQVVLSNTCLSKNIPEQEVPTPERLTDEQLRGLAGWVQHGGGLSAVHCATVIGDSNPNLARLLGGTSFPIQRNSPSLSIQQVSLRIKGETCFCLKNQSTYCCSDLWR